MSDAYHDDPAGIVQPKRKKSSTLVALTLFAVGAFYLQSTLASNLSINSGTPIEFGQGISKTVACSGNTSLTVTPNSTFSNQLSGGAHYFSSIKVSNIPTECGGADFMIDAYGDSDSSPLIFTGATSHGVMVYDNAGTFTSSYGTTISSGSGTFTVTFTNPLALSSSIYKISIQSSSHRTWSCEQGGSCAVGDTGPGGGTVFYVSAGFSCGSSYSSTCKYLEAAPATWYSGTTDQPSNDWGTPNANCYDTGADDSAPRIACNYSGSIYNAATRAAANSDGIANNLLLGMGLMNTDAIVRISGVYNPSSNSYAAGAARAYSGGSKSDWYLPSYTELNQLCKYVRGQAWVSDDTTCSAASATPNLLGMSNTHYNSSSEVLWLESGHNADPPYSRQRALLINHNQNATGPVESGGKNGGSGTRPVRAF